MSFYDVVRTALTLKRHDGVYATARFLKSQGVSAEERRRLLSALATCPAVTRDSPPRHA
jgi:hypothetical protein